MKESIIAKISGIFLILLLLFLTLAIDGCATKPTEVIKYSATFYLYDSKVSLQKERGTLRGLKGFLRVTKDGYEIHTMKWDICNMGHEVYHGLVLEGMDAENHPHFKWSEKK